MHLDHNVNNIKYILFKEQFWHFNFNYKISVIIVFRAIYGTILYADSAATSSLLFRFNFL